MSDKPVKISVDWGKGDATLIITRCVPYKDSVKVYCKNYNRITTPGEVGTAVKDFMMGLEEDNDPTFIDVSQRCIRREEKA